MKKHKRLLPSATMTFEEGIAHAAAVLATDLREQGKDPANADCPLLSGTATFQREDTKVFVTVSIGEPTCVEHLETEFEKIEPPPYWPPLHAETSDLSKE